MIEIFQFALNNPGVAVVIIGFLGWVHYKLMHNHLNEIRDAIRNNTKSINKLTDWFIDHIKSGD